MRHPFRFMNQDVTAIGFSAREIVSRSCRGCRKAARVARVESRPYIGLQISMQLHRKRLLPAGQHLYLAVALSEAKPTGGGTSIDVSRQGIILD